RRTVSRCPTPKRWLRHDDRRNGSMPMSVWPASGPSENASRRRRRACRLNAVVRRSTRRACRRKNTGQHLRQSWLACGHNWPAKPSVPDALLAPHGASIAHTRHAVRLRDEAVYLKIVAENQPLGGGGGHIYRVEAVLVRIFLAHQHGV